MERHGHEVACLTWNVNEARPEAGTALHRWVVDLARDASLFVVALQEIESGGSSLALAAAKDALLAKQQVQHCCAKCLSHLRTTTTSGSLPLEDSTGLQLFICTSSQP